MPGFLGVERLSLGPWQALERGVQRLLLHIGFDDVRMVGGTGDRGGDVVANYRDQTWVVQVKYRSTGQTWNGDVLDEVVNAISAYGASVGVVACNTAFDSKVAERARKLSQDLGVRILLWDYAELIKMFRGLPVTVAERHEPRDYQQEAISAVNYKINTGEKTALVLMATGLGKTRVAAGVIEDWLQRHENGSQVLVLAPSLALIPQLEASLWPYLGSDVPTHMLTGSEKPTFEGGVTVATYQSMANRASEEAGRYDLVIVDEAHHAPADTVTHLLEELSPSFLLGLTATPWRGDERRLESLFGPPAYTMGLVEGMMRGYLAEVDYRMFMDDFDWDWAKDQVDIRMSIGELNKRMFVPQRDDAIVEKLREVLKSVSHPRSLVFCGSKRHADYFSERLKADGIPNQVIHSGLDRFDTTRYLREFRSGKLDMLVTVDMLNEGVDVPDVNVVAFLRVTHSRRIFVQQLGRGLRISPGKEKVTVLDFVSDLESLGQALALNKEAAKLVATEDDIWVRYNEGQIVKFENQENEDFVSRFISDIADVDGEDGLERLRFPV